jgi:hypothetical protein
MKRLTAEQIAAVAGVSVQLVYKKLRMGKSAKQIISEASERENRQTLRDMPVTPVDAVNGHAGVLSFSAAQAQKENWAAKLKQVEYQERCGELIPVQYVRHWGQRFLMEARDLWLRGPSELRDTLASECDPLACEEIVRTFCERVVNTLYQLERLWTPPPPPPGMVA